MKFEDYFSFEAILDDLVKWRLAGKDVGGTLPPRAVWKRGGFRERKGRSAEAVRRAAILRTVRRVYGGGHAGRMTLPCGALGDRALPCRRSREVRDPTMTFLALSSFDAAYARLTERFCVALSRCGRRTPSLQAKTRHGFARPLDARSCRHTAFGFSCRSRAASSSLAARSTSDIWRASA